MITRIGWAGAVVWWGMLSACGGAEPAMEETTPAVGAGEVAPAGAYQTRNLVVTVNEGTNLALAASPDQPARVLSLQGTLFLVDSSGQYTALTDVYYDAREPQLAADGASTVFHGYRRGNWDIWQVDHQGGEPVALTDDAFDDREPQLAADGSRVVFSSDRGGSYDIWQLSLPGHAEAATNQHEKVLLRLTESEHNSTSPSLAADGRLAYAQQLAGTSRIVLQAAAAGSSDTVLVEDLVEELVEEIGTISGVQWSPDATSIGYQLLGRDCAQLKLVNVATKTTRTLSAAGADVFPFRPQWVSANRLAYTVNGKVMELDLASGESADWPFAVDLQLTRHDYARRVRNYDPERQRPVLGITHPAVSADGATVYFTALGDLWRWQPDVQELRALTDDGYADHSPALSPDGKHLAFISDRSGAVGLHVLDLSNGELRKLNVEANQISMPSWSPGGDRLGFFVDVPGNPLGGQLLILDLASGDTETVMEPMPAQPITWSADGKRVAVTRLNPYSTRYREGMYELVVADLDNGSSHVIAPSAHQSITYAGLTPDGAMSYVQGARLWRMELNEQLLPLESAGKLTSEVTDMPAWSSNGEHLVYIAGKRLMQLTVDSGRLRDITPTLTYQLDSPDERYVVRAGRVFDGLSNTYRNNVDIWIEGNRIQSLQAHDATPLPQDVTLIDASQHTVVPGLFDMHAHMGETSEIQGRVWLSYGVTTVRDPGSNPYVAKERQEAWDSGRRVGPRTHITGYLTDGNRVYYSMAEGIVSEQHLADALWRTEQLELDFIKTYVRLPDHWQRQVVDVAHKLGIAASSHELYPAVAYGMDHVEHIGGTSRRGYQPKVSHTGHSYQDVIELLSASGMGITATAVLPGISVIVEEEEDWFETPQFERFYGPAVRRGAELMRARFGEGVAAYVQANGRLLRTLSARDALLVTGTDSPFVPYGAGLHAEFRLYARAGVPNATILRQATAKSAQAAGVANELGTLAAGKLADLVIIDGDPLADIRNLDKVVATIKNGRHYPLAELLR